MSDPSCDPRWEEAARETLVAQTQEARRAVAEEFDDDDLDHAIVLLAIHVQQALMLVEGAFALNEALEQRLADTEVRLEAAVRMMGLLGQLITGGQPIVVVSDN